MSQPPELWVFALTALFVLVPGLGMTALSAGAYYRRGRRELAVAALGFGAITTGGVIDAVYQFGVRGTYELGGRELLTLQAVESALLGAGLLALFLSLRRY